MVSPILDLAWYKDENENQRKYIRKYRGILDRLSKLVDLWYGNYPVGTPTAYYILPAPELRQIITEIKALDAGDKG